MAMEPDIAAENILSGRNPIREALKTGRDLEKLMVAKGELSGSARQIVSMAKAAGVMIQPVERSRLDQIIKNHQGMIAFASAYQYSSVEEILAEAKQKGEEPFVVVLDQVTDPHNVGAIIRSAEVLGFGGVLLPSHGVPPVLPSVVKASAGATEHLPITCAAGVSAYVHAARQRDTCIVALDGKGTASLAEVAAAHPARLLLVCGGEDRGVGQFILNQAQFVVRIPQHGRIGSLNASVAAGIALQALV